MRYDVYLLANLEAGDRNCRMSSEYSEVAVRQKQKKSECRKERRTHRATVQMRFPLKCRHRSRNVCSCEARIFGVSDVSLSKSQYLLIFRNILRVRTDAQLKEIS
jgi:hypothetical protein